MGSPHVDSPEPSTGGFEASVSVRSLVSSGDRPEPSTGCCEPSLADRLFVSRIARSLTTVDLFLDRPAKPLSHPVPGRNRGQGHSHISPMGRPLTRGIRLANPILMAVV